MFTMKHILVIATIVTIAFCQNESEDPFAATPPIPSSIPTSIPSDDPLQEITLGSTISPTDDSLIESNGTNPNTTNVEVILIEINYRLPPYFPYPIHFRPRYRPQPRPVPRPHFPPGYAQNNGQNYLPPWYGQPFPEREEDENERMEDENERMEEESEREEEENERGEDVDGFEENFFK